MKTTRFIMMFVAMAAMMFTSCGKDEENNTDNGDNAEVSGTTWVGHQGNPQTDDSYATYILTFNSDNSCAMSIAFYAASEGGNYATTHFSGTYTVRGNGGTLTMTDDIVGEEYNDTFTVDGDVLTLTHGRVTITMNKSNGGGGDDPTPNPEPTHNELIIGTQHYQMQPSLSITNEGVYLFGASDHNGLFDIIADIPSSMLGQTINLAQASANEHYYINFQSTNLSFALQRGDNPINEINGEEVSAVFTQGTLQVTRENGIVICRVSGTLSNGTYVGFMMAVDEDDIEAMDNQVIFDGQVFDALQVVARHYNAANMPYELYITGAGEGAIAVNVEVEEAAMENSINLAASNYPHRYRVTIYMWDQDTTAMQTNFYSDTFTGDIQGSYWDIAAQASTELNGPVFTTGTLYVSEDDYAIGFTLTGTMECGHSVSAQMRVDKTEIVED